MIYIDLPADLNAEDDQGRNTARLVDAVTPETVTPGAVLVAGAPRAWSWAVVEAVEDGFVYFRQVSADGIRRRTSKLRYRLQKPPDGWWRRSIAATGGASPAALTGSTRSQYGPLPATRLPLVSGYASKSSSVRTGLVRGKTMIHSFAVVIDGVDLTSADSSDADALYEAGCDDALLTSSGSTQRAVFDREAPSFAAAVASAITAIESAVPGARVVGVERLDSADPAPLPHSA